MARAEQRQYSGGGRNESLATSRLARRGMSGSCDKEMWQMKVLGFYRGFLRALAVASVGVSLASCSLVNVQSPLDYIGPAKGTAGTQAAPIQALGANPTTGAVTTQPAPTATAPAAPSTPGEMAPAGGEDRKSVV
jgi:hypothetical protein